MTVKFTVPMPNIWVVLALGILARIIALQIDFSFTNDVLTFQAWAIQLHNYGFRAFYLADTFSDYPPVYMYVLFLLGWFRSLFEWPVLGPVFNFFTFLPAMAADLVIGYIIYRMFAEKDKAKALLFSAAWVLNPAIIFISSIWGQVESVFSVILLLSLIKVRQQKLLPGYILFGIAILTKPQSLFLAPIYLYSALKQISGHIGKPTKNRVYYLMGSVVAALGVMIVLSIPFGLRETFDIVVSGADLRPFASINAFNFWGFFGGNWVYWGNTFIGVSYFTWGMVILVSIILGALYALHIDYSRHGGRHFYLIAAALFVLIFVFSVRMHERYLFPGLLFLLIYFAESFNRRLLWLYGAFSVTYFLNCYYVILWLQGGGDISVFDVALPVISFANIVFGLLLIWVIIQEIWPYKNVEAEGRQHGPPLMSKGDWGFLGALIVVYSIVAFINLGNIRSPQTAFAPDETSQGEIIIYLNEPQFVSRFQYMMGSRHDRGFSLLDAHGNPIYYTTGSDVFAWHEGGINAYGHRFTLLYRAEPRGLRLQEIAFRDANDELIHISAISAHAAALIDEQYLVPKTRGFMNSTYFDEIYHPRTGYEYLHGLPIYETTHPPMGKNFIAMSVAVFGMTPFGWRFPGTFFGILMIPLLYAFARKLLKSNKWALFAAFIFTFDFMHFAQTRLATIDTYVTFFVIAMYFVMYLYITGVDSNSLKKSLGLLAVCGVMMGLAIASKWQGVYGAAGLPLLFFPALYKLYLRDKKQALVTFASCFGFFIAVPVFIYILSYIPFVNAQGGPFLRTVWNNQVHMFTYHSELVAEHPFSSNWWSWPLMTRPIWLYVSAISEGVRAGITSFGNPAVWWFGIFATFFAGYILYRKNGREYDLVFLLVAYAAQYLPWVMVDRLVFIYHYFPSLPFVVLIIAWFFKNHVRRRGAVIAYAAAVILLFILFYPVLAGVPVSIDFVRDYLRWLPGWIFV